MKQLAHVHGLAIVPVAACMNDPGMNWLGYRKIRETGKKLMKHIRLVTSNPNTHTYFYVLWQIFMICLFWFSANGLLVMASLIRHRCHRVIPHQ